MLKYTDNYSLSWLTSEIRLQRLITVDTRHKRRACLCLFALWRAPLSVRWGPPGHPSRGVGYLEDVYPRGLLLKDLRGFGMPRHSRVANSSMEFAKSSLQEDLSNFSECFAARQRDVLQQQPFVLPEQGAFCVVFFVCYQVAGILSSTFVVPSTGDFFSGARRRGFFWR